MDMFREIKMEQETTKLLNVLRRIALRPATLRVGQTDPESARFCVTQYNKVLARLTELEPSVKQLFIPLTEDKSPEVTRIAVVNCSHTSRWMSRNFAGVIREPSCLVVVHATHGPAVDQARHIVKCAFGVGLSQYRNAVASGPCSWKGSKWNLVPDATALRY